jgi:uncharacterized iron-regulated protein
LSGIIFIKDKQMSRYSKITFFILFSFFFLTITCQADINRQIFKIGAGETTFPAMIKEISSASVIFFGEDHYDLINHKNQLEVIKALYEKGLPIAIGLEMFPKKDQRRLDDWISGRLNEKDFIPIFYEDWGYGWDLYKDIFFYAREKNIPLIGLNVTKEITRKVAQKGFKSLSREELSELPPGITCDLNKRYMDFIKRIFEYKGNNDYTFHNFCEAQMIWDQSMAWHLSQYLKENPYRLVIVLTGTVHAWKYGIPRQLEKFINVEYRVILPDMPGDYSTITKDDADYMFIH